MRKTGANVDAVSEAEAARGLCSCLAFGTPCRRVVGQEMGACWQRELGGGKGILGKGISGTGMVASRTVFLNRS
jgi:hypothetical protein